MMEALGREVGGRQRIEDLERPQLDDRSYRIITLPNRLEVLLIHEAGTDKASAALDVNVGSFSDPPEMPGIAHAVEHVLYMGTEKYPEENAFKRFLTRYGGYSNASTNSTSTNYHFELSYPSSTPTGSQAASPDVSQTNLAESKDEPPLWGALFRFGQCFISPLFLEDTVDRELKAVDSENKENFQNDTWRMHQLNKALVNPDHPYNHFSTGNYETLHDEPIARGVKIRDEFVKFHSTHYSANRMKLVVLGRESLDTLEAWAEIFAKVPNKDLGQNRWDMPLFTSKELLTQIFAKPISESLQLELQFPYRDEVKYYESSPSEYSIQLLGHEGPGSVFAFLKEKGWAVSLVADHQNLFSGGDLFAVQIALSEEGLKQYKQIVKYVFQYIGFMRDQPPQEWFMEEHMRMSEVRFQRSERKSPSETTSELASLMQAPYERRSLLSGPFVIKKFDSELISEGLSYLRPDNFRMTIVSQDFPGGWNQKEKWSGTEYKVEKIPEDFLAEIEQAFKSKNRPPELHFPYKNEFIPMPLDVAKKDVEQPTKEPKLIRHGDNVRAWWKKDNQSRLPLANVRIYFRTSMAEMTARVIVLGKMFRRLVNDALEEFSYAAKLSDLNYIFSDHIGGFSVVVSGYNENLDVLLEKILLKVRDPKISQDRFKVVHEQALRSLRNGDYEEPSDQVYSDSEQFKSEMIKMHDELLPELEIVTVPDVQQLFPQRIAQCQIEILAHGNLSKEEALKMVSLVDRIIEPKGLPASLIPKHRTFIWPSGYNFIYTKQTKGIHHSTEYNLYVGNSYNSAIRAQLLLLGQLIKEPCYNQLRTIEQLSYAVSSGPSFYHDWAGYSIFLQSEKDCRYLEYRIENFLRMLEKTLNDMSEEEFETHKRVMMDNLRGKLSDMISEGDRFWGYIVDGSYDFLQTDVDAVTLEKLTKKDIVDFYNQYISTSSPQRSKLSVHLQAQAKAKEPSLDERKTAAAAALKIILAEHKITANDEAFQTRMKDVSSKDAIPDAVATHLTDDLKVEKEVANKVLEEATAALGVADSGLTAAPQALDASADVKSIVDASHPVLIEDVHAWKASMQVSSGVRPVRNLEEFVEVAEKL